MVASNRKAVRALKAGREKNGVGFIIFGVLLIAVTLYPLLYMIAISLSTRENLAKVVLYPIGLTTMAYEAIFRIPLFYRGFLNSFFYTVVGTVFSMLLTTLVAYPVSKTWLKGRRFYTIFMMITMYFSGGLIPSFIVNTKMLGLYNNVWAILIPGALSTWNAVVMMTFFRGIPYELEEAAFIDGANEFHILTRIFIPLSKPIFATLSLFYGVGMWNSWFGPQIYLKDEALYPIQLILRNMMQNFGGMPPNLGGVVDMTKIDPVSLNYALTVVVILPVVVLFPFVQKYFKKGVIVGSLKG